MKLCKDQLAEKLVGLFTETDPQNIDEAVAQAKGQLAQKAKQLNRSGFKQLFYTQIATLNDRGVPRQILEAIRNGEAKVLDYAESITIADGNLPFAPVITPLYLGYHGIVSLVRNGNKQGYTYLDLSKIEDIEKVPNRLYYQFDIENGAKYLGRKPETSDKLIRDEKRLRSTATEVVSIGIHTDVLSKHYVNAVGSRYDSVRVPNLDLSDGRPKLGWDYLDLSNYHWGAASCGSRLEL